MQKYIIAVRVVSSFSLFYIEECKLITQVQRLLRLLHATVVSLINGVFDSALKRLLHCSFVTKRVFCEEFSISGYAL